MLVTLSNSWAALVGAVVWAVASIATGYVANRLPVSTFDHDNALTRLRPFEADGRFYERWWRIRRWKRWLPEGGDIFDGGFNKKHLRGRDDAHLERFIAETRRAEITHWVAMTFGPLFYLWSSWFLGTVMVVFGVLFNLPFVVAQRYNRARLERVLTRRARRRGATDDVGDPPHPGT